MNRKTLILLLFICSVAAGAAAIHITRHHELSYVPPSEQQYGDAQKGYNYLIYGDYIKSGLSYGYYRLLQGKDHNNYLGRTGKAAVVPYIFNVVKNADSLDLVVPNCFTCHAQEFEGKLYPGLGNSTIDFSQSNKTNFAQNTVEKFMQTFARKRYNAGKDLITSLHAVLPYLKTEVQGVNAAQRLTILLAAHRDPQSLKWSDEPLMNFPDEVVPTDVPAWWMLKKKNAMFYNGFGRGDFGKFLMMSNILTSKDSSETREVSTHFGDVLAYINTVQPPKYTHPINQALAEKGRKVFTNNCAKCHGDYGSNASYPNLLVPSDIIQTDSLLFKSNFQNPEFIEWFNKSWFATTDHPAKLEPFNGYIAPPLDGIWITAPYLHNGSVPTLMALLNSSLRPKYWQRNFKKPEYDYENVGWKYTAKEKPSKKTYNTTLAGYGNYGHTFGDMLTDDERKAVIEYLKTL